MRLLFLIMAIANPLAGCGPLPLSCTEEARTGLTVRVFDASGERVCSAYVVAKSADHEETLTDDLGGDPAKCAYSGLVERAGSFTVTATSARFNGQLTKTVTIDEDGCHVIPQLVELRAQ